MIWGWGVAQFPYLLPTSLRIDQAAAPGPTLDSVLVVFAIAAVVVLPSLGLLYGSPSATCSGRRALAPKHPFRCDLSRHARDSAQRRGMAIRCVKR